MKKIEPKNLTAESLVALVKETQAKVFKDAEKREKEHAASVAGLTSREDELKFDIGKAKELLEKMTVDFEAMERDEQKAFLAKVRADAVSEADVKSGKATMAQFHATGVADDEALNTAREKAAEVLDAEADAIREKAEEIVRMELALANLQNSLHGMLLNPVRLLQQSYKDMEGLLDFQLGKLIEDGNSARSLSKQKENEVMLIESGVSVNSVGHVWRAITFKEAYRIRFDPILPSEHVALLTRQLVEAEPMGGEDALVTVTYHTGPHWPGDPVTVMVEGE